MKEQVNKAKEMLKEFGLTSFAVDNGTSVFILTLIVLLMGWNSYRSMPKELYPEVVIPTIYVGTAYPGTSAPDMENLVSRPIEKEIKSITGVKKINSTSIQDYSTVIVEFNTDVEIPQALQDVKDAVDKAKSELPTDLPSDPDVFDINFSEIPIMTVNLSGEYTVDELRGYAEYFQDKIEGLSEISEVEIKGALEREVKIDVDLLKMESMQLNFDDISNAISSENMTMSGGEVLANGFRRAIRVVGEFETAEQIGNIIVKSENLNPIYLRDIADVSLGFVDATSYARSDQLPVVSCDIIKRAGANLVEAADKISAIVEESKADVPADLKVAIFNDQSVMVKTQLKELENSIISGVILVVLVLLFFLGGRNSMFVGIAIPLSMLMGVGIINIMGYTMNMMVLFALILALGLLVDNAIVVVENIYRYMQEGYSGKDAAKKGAGEVAVPIIASTATTLAAFLPLLFWGGLMGSFMKYLPITLIIVLSSSLFVALVINPVFTSRFMSVAERSDDKTVRRRKVRNNLIAGGILLALAAFSHFGGNTTMRNVFFLTGTISLLYFFALRPAGFFFQNKILPWLENGYDKFVRFALRGWTPWAVFGGAFLLLFIAIGLLAFRMPQIVYFPNTMPQYVNVFVEMPMGTDIEVTNQTVRELENRITATVAPYEQVVESILTQIGEGTGDPSMPQDPGSTPNKARITVSFVPTQDRGGISTFEIMEKIRLATQGIPGVKIVIDKDASGPPTGKPINIELTGENMDRLATLAEDVVKYFNDANVPGVEELQVDVKTGKPELIVNIDREEARRYGVSTYSIAMAIRTAIFGKEASKLKVGEEEYPIQIRLDKKYRYDIDAIMNQKVTFRDPGSGQISQVPIAAVADIKYSTTYSAIKRTDLDRAITIYSNVIDGYNPNEVNDELKGLLDDYGLPDGYKYSFSGEQEQQAEDFAFLSQAFMFAILIIFLILVAQFNSVLSPFIIMLSVLFSTIGVFLGYFFTQMDLVVIMTGIGIISLAGIVVNNAIVLIDYINLTYNRLQEENEGTEQAILVKQAIIHAGKTRLRPVLLTAITTVLGLIPLAVGLNIDFASFVTSFDPKFFVGGDNVVFWGTMSWTVIYGLVFATFLTLIVVPVMYWLFYRMKEGALRLVSKK